MFLLFHFSLFKFLEHRGWRMKRSNLIGANIGYPWKCRRVDISGHVILKLINFICKLNWIQFFKKRSNLIGANIDYPWKRTSVFQKVWVDILKIGPPVHFQCIFSNVLKKSYWLPQQTCFKIFHTTRKSCKWFSYPNTGTIILLLVVQFDSENCYQIQSENIFHSYQWTSIIIPHKY